MHYLQALAAHVLWGVFPIYWKIFRGTVDPFEIICHRILWSLVTLIVLVSALGQWSEIRRTMLSPKKLGLATLAAFLISVNWLVFIWAVVNDAVLDASLGYFINPLFSVLLGVVVFRERLVSVQWIAIAIAATGLLLCTYSSPRLWVAFVLATSFSIYGVVKKETKLPAIAGLGIETAILAPLAAAYLAYCVSGRSESYSGTTLLLLALGGPITTIPLVLFSAASKHVPLVYMGMMQYVGPTVQFVLGWFLFEETVPLTRFYGFNLVWLALAIFSGHALSKYRFANRSINP